MRVLSSCRLIEGPSGWLANRMSAISVNEASADAGGRLLGSRARRRELALAGGRMEGNPPTCRVATDSKAASLPA